MAIQDGVTAFNGANVPHKSGPDTITGPWAFTKAVATAGGFNFIDNADLETWAAGPSAPPTGYGALAGDGATIAREGGAGNFKQGAFSAALTRVGTDCYLPQNVLTKYGPVGLYQSQPMVLGAWVKASVANRARIAVDDGVTVTYSPYHSGGGAFEFLTVAVTVNVAATKLEVRLVIDTGNTTAYFDGVVLAYGTGLQGLWWPNSGAGGGGAAALVLPELAPENATFPSANFPELKKNVGANQVDYTLDFDQAAAEFAHWSCRIPAGAVFTGATIELTYRQAAAVAGNVMFEVATLTRGDGETWDTAGVVDTFAASTVPGFAGQVRVITKALTITGWGASRDLLIKLSRKAADAGDTVAEDCKMMRAVVRLT